MQRWRFCLVLAAEDDGVMKGLLVSTQVLALASLVMHKLFRGSLSEACAIRAGDKPSINLPDDKPHVMEMVLCIPHHGAESVNTVVRNTTSLFSVSH